MIFRQITSFSPGRKRFYAYAVIALVSLIAYFMYARWAGPLYKGSRIRIWVQAASTDAEAYDTVIEIGPRTVPFIIEELTRSPDDDSKVIRKLLNILPNSVAQRLPLGRSDSSPWRLLEVLNKIEVDESCAPQVIDLIKSADPSWGPISVLGKLPEIALPHTRAWLASSVPTEQYKGLLLAEALGPQAARLAPRVAPFAQAADPQQMRTALVALSRMGPMADPFVYEILSSTNEHAARRMVGFIGRQQWRHPQLLPFLIKNTMHGDDQVRARSVRALGKIAPANGEVQSIVRARLKDDQLTVRLSAAHALVRFATRPEDLLSITQELLGTQQPELCRITLSRLLAQTKLQFTENQKEHAAELGLERSLSDAAHLDAEAAPLAIVHLAALFPHKDETLPMIKAAMKSKERETRAAAHYALSICRTDAVETLHAAVEASNSGDIESIDLAAFQVIARNRPETFVALKTAALQSSEPVRSAWLMLTPRELAAARPSELLMHSRWFRKAIDADAKEDRWPF
ncbi:MAG TPA: HEAT repeat domain-containing protein [Methylomirabilota bacterium]|nr:HEAT repeat domain-containing protein [Methylomirabilota bacterium]